MLEHFRAQIVDHPLADRNRDVVVEHIDKTEHHVEHYQPYAGRDQQMRRRKPADARRPRRTERHAAQYVIDHHLERPRLEHLERRSERHAHYCQRETPQMRTRAAQHHADESERAHQAASSSTWARAPSAAAAPAAAALSAAGRRLRCSTASAAAPSPTVAAAASAAVPEKPVASIATTIAAALAPIRRPAGAARHESATRPSSSSSPLRYTRIPGGTMTMRS